MLYGAFNDWSTNTFRLSSFVFIQFGVNCEPLFRYVGNFLCKSWISVCFWILKNNVRVGISELILLKQWSRNSFFLYFKLGSYCLFLSKILVYLLCAKLKQKLKSSLIEFQSKHWIKTWCKNHNFIANFS